jgi:hypothetical protein
MHMPVPLRARPDRTAEGNPLSTESIATSTRPVVAGAPVQCATCGALLASDQRYCLECGERQATIASLVPSAESVRPSAEPVRETVAQPPTTPPRPPGLAPPTEARHTANTPAAIAGVGVLLLAMGVGVLIGRSGNVKQTPAAAPQVLTVTGAAAPGGSAGVSEPSFSGDWSSAGGGYTVQLQTLPLSGTTVSAVAAAKAAATGRGAKAVGALRSDEFSSLASGSYVIYSGVYHKRSQAAKALLGLRKSFPNAQVIAVSSRRSASSENSSSAGSRAGSSVTKPAPSSVLEGLKEAKGKSYEEKSKNLPDVVSTG